MKLKLLVMCFGLAVSTPIFAEVCVPGFGPGCVPPPGPTPAPERIPIPAYLPTVFIGGTQFVVPDCEVVMQDFVKCKVTLSGGYKVGGDSPSCPPANQTCDNLWVFAVSDLKLNVDAALRAKSSIYP
jgi:hypothetical protein